MKGRRKFNEKTDQFTPRDRKVVEEKKAKIRAALQRSGKPSEFPKAVPRIQARRSNPGSRR
jgi:hypothetical protein